MKWKTIQSEINFKTIQSLFHDEFAMIVIPDFIKKSDAKSIMTYLKNNPVMKKYDYDCE